MKYILDTDILSYFLKNHPQVVKRFRVTDPDDIAITVINYAELLFGAYKTENIERKLPGIQAFLETLTVVNFDKRAGEIFAQLKTTLQKSGNILADMDLIIASICVVNGCILATNNTKHFEKIERLPIENWSLPSDDIEPGEQDTLPNN